MAKIALMIGIGILGAVTGGLGWLAFAGVAAGGAAGAVAGATLGMSIGGIVGSLLFPPNLGNQEGPRLSDLKVSTSTAGAAIPFGYNTDRHGANIIWSPGLVEHKSVEKHSSKGGPTYTTTTYSYTASFAAAFGEGPDIIHRIWGDTKLIYGTALYTEPNAESIRVEPVNVYCYTGSGTGIFTRTSVGSPAATFLNKAGLMFNTHPNVLLPGDPHNSADESFPPVHHPVTTYGTYGGDEVLTGCPTPSFDMIMTGKFIVSLAGDYTFKAFADDGYFIGIAGTSLTSGPQLGSHPGTTPKMGYPVTWWSNQPQSYRDTGIHGDPAVVNFPSPGEYAFEICWTEDGSGQNQFSLMLGNVTEDANPADNVGALRAYKVIKPAIQTLGGYETPPLVSPDGPKYPPPTIYPGDELQMPDPTIQTNKGAANVSANRGLCYAVWEDFALADFGNRIPSIRGEVEFLLYDPAGDATLALSAAAVADQVEDLCIRATIPLADIDVTQLLDISPSFGGTGGTTLDGVTITQIITPTGWHSNFATAGEDDLLTAVFDKDGTTAWLWQLTNPGFARVNLLDNTLIFSGNIFDNVAGDQSCFPVYRADNHTWFLQDDDGNYYIQYESGLTSNIYRLRVGSSDPSTIGNGYLTVDGSCTIASISASHTQWSSGLWFSKVWKHSAVNYIGFPASRYMFVMRTDTMAKIGEYDSGSSSNATCGGFVDKNGHFWAVWHNTGTAQFSFGDWNPAGGGDGTTLAGVVRTNVANATVGMANSNNVQCMYIGDGSNHAVLLTNAQTGETAVLDLASFALIAYRANDTYQFIYSGVSVDTPSTTMLQSGHDTAINQGQQADGTVALQGSTFPWSSTGQQGGLLRIIDPVTLTSTSETNITTILAAYLHVEGSGFGMEGAYPPFGSFYHQRDLSRTLVNFYYRDSNAYGQWNTSPTFLIGPSAAEAPGVSPTCLGYMIGRPTSARACIQPLAQAFFFDACESDGKIKFISRGGTSVITIPEDDLGLEADKAELTEQIGQEQDLPREVTIIFSDPALDYQQNKASKRRSGRVVKTANQLTVELPIVMDKGMARQVAEKALYLAYSERKPYELNLWKASYMVLDPCDIISFVYEGLTFEMRVVREGIGAGYTVALSGVSEDARNYLSTATGATSDGFVPGTVTPTAGTLLWLFDLPLLRDSDSVPGSTGYYFAMGTTTASWPGGLLYKSSDDVDFSFEASSNSPVSFGIATNVLAAPNSPWSWDDDNTVNVILLDGSLAGATDLNVLNGQNALLLGSEVIQFGTCVQETDGSYTLSHLLRGRRGTEWACDTHVVNETAIDPYTGLEHMTAAMSVIGQDRFYKAITAGQVLSNATSQEFMLEGADLKPYAPVHITGSRASDDLTIRWVRRTRLGGDWLDGAGDVPVSEDREMYEVDVLTGPLGTVVRTFSNLINPQVLYLASDQVIDFGSAQSSVSVVVYQVSAQVGRGFGAEATI